MRIDEAFKKLSFGVFSNLDLGVEGTGAITEAKQPAIVQHINTALLRLYTRFVLKEKIVMLEQVNHITNYYLREKYSQSRAPVDGVAFPYILDLEGEPFIEDVIRVYAVFDGTGGALPLNDEEQPHSVFTPQPDLIQIPNPTTGRATSAAYQARHAELTVEDLTAEIELPVALEEAMLAYVAYLVYTNMNTQENSIKAQEHLNRYESLCQEAIDRDIVSSSVSTTNTRFEKRGWI